VVALLYLLRRVVPPEPLFYPHSWCMLGSETNRVGAANFAALSRSKVGIAVTADAKWEQASVLNFLSRDLRFCVVSGLFDHAAFARALSK
jgi:hypothetical protein